MATFGSASWAPSPSDFYRTLQEQNPWAETGHVPQGLAPPVRRPLADLVWRRLGSASAGRPHRYQVIVGPRRVGKTTCQYQAVQSLLAQGVEKHRVWWLRLDHPRLIDRPLDEVVRVVLGLAAATEESPAYLFLDEVTYAERWDLWLKTFFDERWPLRIIGSSSATAALRDRHLESGVGRWEEQYLSPYLFDEYLDLIGQPAQVSLGRHLGDSIERSVRTAWRPDARVTRSRQLFLLVGGFPELLVNSPPAEEETDEHSRILVSQRTLRSDAVHRAVYKDIPQVYSIENPKQLERLLYVLADNMTGLLSPKNVCQTLDSITASTFERYLGYLERSFLVFTLPNYSGSEERIQRRGRKIYFTDGAVRNAALERGLTPLQQPSEMGVLIENACASHLHALAQQTQTRLYHWREGDAEVDLVYDHHEAPLAFEIGLDPRHTKRHLHAFTERYPRFKDRAYLVSPGVLPRAAEDAGGVGELPLDLFLILVGRLAAAALAERVLPGSSGTLS